VISLIVFLYLAINSFASLSTTTSSSKPVNVAQVSPRVTDTTATAAKKEPVQFTFNQSSRINESLPTKASVQPSAGIAVTEPPLTSTASSEILTPAEKDKIKQVAEFCAKKGVAKLNSLRDNPESRTIMPFLFKGNPGHEEFMLTLKSLVGFVGNPMPQVIQQPIPTQPLLPASPQQQQGGSYSHYMPHPSQQQPQQSFQGQNNRPGQFAPNFPFPNNAGFQGQDDEYQIPPGQYPPQNQNNSRRSRFQH
jgi:hypothetical protein